MKIRKNNTDEQKVELQMTPMIDIVFQLLIFFIMTFKIVPREGDFNIRMPQASPSQAMPDESLLPLRIQLTANSEGELSGIQLNEQDFRDFVELREYVIGYLADVSGPESAKDSAEVELDCDYDLRYEFVVRAITAVSGYRDKATNQVIPLVERIKFTPPDARAP